MNQTTTYKDPSKLTAHPLRKHIPAPDRRTPEWAAMVDAMQNSGPEVIPPIIISPDDQVMDGGWRWLAARELEWEKIKCEVQAESRAGIIVVETLIHRKHMSRGAAVYLVLPALKSFIDAAEDRRLANLREGVKTREKPLIFPNVRISNIGEELLKGSETNSELCRVLGVSPATLYRAIRVRKLLDGNTSLKAVWEPRLLSGELNLWGVESGIAGAQTDQSNRENGVLTAQLELFTNSFSSIRKAAFNWGKFRAEQRDAVLNEWADTCAELPPELANAMIERLKLREPRGFKKHFPCA